MKFTFTDLMYRVGSFNVTEAVLKCLVRVNLVFYTTKWCTILKFIGCKLSVAIVMHFTARHIA